MIVTILYAPSGWVGWVLSQVHYHKRESQFVFNFLFTSDGLTSETQINLQ